MPAPEPDKSSKRVTEDYQFEYPPGLGMLITRSCSLAYRLSDMQPLREHAKVDEYFSSLPLTMLTLPLVFSFWLSCSAEFGFMWCSVRGVFFRASAGSISHMKLRCFESMLVAGLCKQLALYYSCWSYMCCQNNTSSRVGQEEE